MLASFLLETSTPKFRIHGSQEVAQIYLSSWVALSVMVGEGLYTNNIANINSTLLVLNLPTNTDLGNIVDLN